MSTTKAEYIAAESCYAQILWIKQQLIDFGIELKNIPIRCDNISAINLTKNLTNTLGQNTLKIDIILLENMFKIMI